MPTIYYKVLSQTEDQRRKSEIVITGPLEGIEVLRNNTKGPTTHVQILNDKVVASFRKHDLLKVQEEIFPRNL